VRGRAIVKADSAWRRLKAVAGQFEILNRLDWLHRSSAACCRHGQDSTRSLAIDEATFFS